MPVTKLLKSGRPRSESNTNSIICSNIYTDHETPVNLLRHYETCCGVCIGEGRPPYTEGGPIFLRYVADHLIWNSISSSPSARSCSML